MDPVADKPRVKRAQSAKPRTVVAARPANFERLQRFFASQTALAAALGVHRDTVRKWERGEASRLRRSSIERVTVMAAVAEQVARYMPSDASVGSWLLHPQPALGGQIPAVLVRTQGPKAYEPIVSRAAAIAEPVSVGDLSDLVDEKGLLVAAGAKTGEAITLAPGAEDPDANPGFREALEAASATA